MLAHVNPGVARIPLAMIIDTAELEMPGSASAAFKTALTTQSDFSPGFMPAFEAPIIKSDMACRFMVGQNMSIYFALAGAFRFLIIVWLIPVV